MKNDSRHSDDRKRPFFARFLEGQLRVKTGLRAGGETKPRLDLDQTMKAPSDNDEI